MSWTFPSEQQFTDELTSGTADVSFHNITCTGDAFGFPAPVLPPNASCEELTVTNGGEDNIVLNPESLTFHATPGGIAGTTLTPTSVRTATLNPIGSEIECTGILSATEMWTSTSGTEFSKMTPTQLYTANGTQYANTTAAEISVGDYATGHLSQITSEYLQSTLIKANTIVGFAEVTGGRVVTSQLSSGTVGGPITLYGSQLTNGSTTDLSSGSTQMATVAAVWEIAAGGGTLSKIQNQPGQAGQYYAQVKTIQALQFVSTTLQHTVITPFTHACSGPDFQIGGVYYDNITVCANCCLVNTGTQNTNPGYIIQGVSTTSGTLAAGNFVATIYASSDTTYSGEMVILWTINLWMNPI